MKNTAIGIHAGPVGSITTSSRVPARQPAEAAVQPGPTSTNRPTFLIRGTRGQPGVAIN